MTAPPLMTVRAAGAIGARKSATSRSVRAARDRIAKLATLDPKPTREQLDSLRAELDRVRGAA